MNHEDRLLDVKHLADKLDLSESTIRRWIRAGHLHRAGLMPSRGSNGYVALYRLSEAMKLADGSDTPTAE